MPGAVILAGMVLQYAIRELRKSDDREGTLNSMAREGWRFVQQVQGPKGYAEFIFERGEVGEDLHVGGGFDVASLAPGAPTNPLTQAKTAEKEKQGKKEKAAQDPAR